MMADDQIQDHSGFDIYESANESLISELLHTEFSMSPKGPDLKTILGYHSCFEINYT